MPETCTAPACARPVHARDLCKPHHGQWCKLVASGLSMAQARAALRPLRTVGPAACAFPDCGRRVAARGYCIGHYAQQRRGSALHPLRGIAPRWSSWDDWRGPGVALDYRGVPLGLPWLEGGDPPRDEAEARRDAEIDAEYGSAA